MREFHPDPIEDSRSLRQSFLIALSFALLLWVIKGAEFMFGLHLSHFGVYPQRLDALTGILSGPLIHSSFSHLFSNTTALVILGTSLLYGYPRSAKVVIPVVWLVSGLGVWLFARSSWHIGASGLTFGMMFFIFTIGVLRWDRRAISLALVVFFLYGSMIWGIFPGDPKISFESHFFGAASGLMLAFLLKQRDPAPPEKHYSWEDEADSDDI